MKTIYVAHPFRGDEVKNAGRVAEICRELHKDYPDYLFVSPIHAFSWFRDDHEGALEHCLRMLARCDELWLFGEWQNSAGCMMEWDAARNLGIEICAPIRLGVTNSVLRDLENQKAVIEAKNKTAQQLQRDFWAPWKGVE